MGLLRRDNESRWLKYNGTPNRMGLDAPRVTLTEKRTFRLNQHAVKALGSPAAVELFFDPKTATIGLAPRDPRLLNVFPLRDHTQTRSKTGNPKYLYRVIHALPFCRKFDINPEHTMLFTNIEIDNEGTMLLELTTAVKVGRGSR